MAQPLWQPCRKPGAHVPDAPKSDDVDTPDSGLYRGGSERAI